MLYSSVNTQFRTYTLFCKFLYNIELLKNRCVYNFIQDFTALQKAYDSLPLGTSSTKNIFFALIYAVRDGSKNMSPIGELVNSSNTWRVKPDFFIKAMNSFSPIRLLQSCWNPLFTTSS